MNKIKFYRLTQGLPLKTVAIDTGLSLGHLSHLENEDKQPSKASMELVAKALSRTVPEVFYEEYTDDDFTKLKQCGYIPVIKDGNVTEIVREGSVSSDTDL